MSLFLSDIHITVLFWIRTVFSKRVTPEVAFLNLTELFTKSPQAEARPVCFIDDVHGFDMLMISIVFVQHWHEKVALCVSTRHVTQQSLVDFIYKLSISLAFLPFGQTVTSTSSTLPAVN